MAYHVEAPLRAREIDPELAKPGEARDCIDAISDWLLAEEVHARHELHRFLTTEREEAWAAIQGNAAYPGTRHAANRYELIGRHDAILALASKLLAIVEEWRAES